MGKLRCLVLVLVAGCSADVANAPGANNNTAPRPPHKDFYPWKQPNPYAIPPGQPDNPNPDPGQPQECNQRTFTGAAIGTAEKQWAWVPFPEAKCRDGSSTGIGVRLNSASSKV